jgi:hypothetical protein
MPNEEFIVGLLSQLASVQKLLVDNNQMDAADVIEVTAMQLVGLASFFLRENAKKIIRLMLKTQFIKGIKCTQRNLAAEIM